MTSRDMLRVLTVVAVSFAAFVACTSASGDPGSDNPSRFVESRPADGEPVTSWCVAPGVRVFSAGYRPSERYGGPLDVYGWQNSPEPERRALACP